MQDYRAPVNHYGSQNSTRPFNPKLLEEFQLFDINTQAREREIVETLGEIYSIIITLDHVEKAYLKDDIGSDEYTALANKLINQYRTYLSDKDVEERFHDLETFKTKWQITASNAITRLERGIPVTVEHGTSGDFGSQDNISQDGTANGVSNGNNKYSGKRVAEATGNFITVMDALKLNYKTREQLHPLMSELLLSVNRVTSNDFESRNKLVEWIIKINKLKNDESLSDSEVQQLLYALESAYKSFYTLLE